MQNLLSLIKDLTLHPQNISELKGLILQLAIQGKLTQKWREENPELVSGSNSASALLAQIQEEKERLIKEKKIRKEKAVPEISEDEINYVLPSPWAWSRMGNLGIVNPRNQLDDGLDIGFIPMKDISDQYGIKPVYELRKWSSVKSSFTHFANRDIAFAKITPCFENSKSCVFNELPNGMGAGTTELHVLRPVLEEFCSEFIYLIFKSPNFLNEGESKMTGSAGQKRVPKDFFSNYLVGFPPLEEQKAIVRIVDELFKEVDELSEQVKFRTQLKEDYVTSACRELTENTQATWRDMVPLFPEFFDTKPNIKKMRETILQLAVQGKLTASWRKSHPELVSGSNSASALLDKIKAEKEQLIKEKKIKKEHKLHPKAKDKPIFNVPDLWEMTRFWEVIWCYRGHNPPKSEFIHEPRTGYVRFVQITDFKTDSKAVYVPDSRKLKMVYKGEILMAAYRHIGKLSRKMEGAFNVALCKVNCIEPYNIDFLELLIGTSIVKGELLAESERGHIPSMHSDHLLSLWVPIPPLEEQKAIVEQVNDLMTLCDQLEEAVATSESQVLDLMKSVVREATSSDKTSKVSMRPYKDLGGLESASMAAEPSPADKEGGGYGG